MDIGNLINEMFIQRWYIWYFFILLYIYSRYSDKRPFKNTELDSMIMFVEYGFYLLIIYFIQTRLFNEHYYFLASLPIFLFVWGTVINYLLSRDNVFLVETALENEEFYDLNLKKKFRSMATRVRIIIMDRGHYETKNHIGNSYNPLQKTSRRIKFTNYYDDENGNIYHSSYPELQNINMFTLTGLILKLKEDVPKVMEENTKHTFLENYKLAIKIDPIIENLSTQLMGIKKQHQNTPFILVKDIDEFVKQTEKLKQKEDNINQIEETIEGE